MTSNRSHRIGSTVLHFPILASTNGYASDYLAKIRPKHGTVITADNQPAGRGQFGRAWTSEAGQNLTMSIILYPEFPAAQQFKLGIMAALAVRDMLGNYVGGNVKIKWPNDIYVERKKIAGILIRNVLAGKKISMSIMGIGVNVNQRLFPAHIPNPTSIALETNARYDVSNLALTLCTILDNWWHHVHNLTLDELVSRYNEVLYYRGELARFTGRKNGLTITGMVNGVDTTGRLGLLIDGELKQFSFHEIRQVIT